MSPPCHWTSMKLSWQRPSCPSVNNLLSCRKQWISNWSPLLLLPTMGSIGVRSLCVPCFRSSHNLIEECLSMEYSNNESLIIASTSYRYGVGVAVSQVRYWKWAFNFTPKQRSHRITSGTSWHAPSPAQPVLFKSSGRPWQSRYVQDQLQHT
jgi:hypothetical protein